MNNIFKLAHIAANGQIKGGSQHDGGYQTVEKFKAGIGRFIVSYDNSPLIRPVSVVS